MPAKNAYLLRQYTIIIDHSLLISNDWKKIFNVIQGILDKYSPLHVLRSDIIIINQSKDESYTNCYGWLDNLDKIDSISVIDLDMETFIKSQSHKVLLLSAEEKFGSFDVLFNRINSDSFYIGCIAKTGIRTTPYEFLHFKKGSVKPAVQQPALPTNSPKAFRRLDSFSKSNIIKENFDELVTALEFDYNTQEFITNGVLLSFNNNSAIIIADEIGSGTEGCVFNIQGHSDLVCKLYLPDKLTKVKISKLHLMLRNASSFNHPAICWVTDLVTYNGTVCGFVMKKARGQPLSNVLGYTKIKRDFPGWTREKLINIAISQVDVINFLHTKEVLVSDMNLNNIFIDNGTICFIDIDSCQIENIINTTVDNEFEFVAPEIQGKHLEALKTKESELFAVAVLLFKTLMVSFKIYSHNQDEDEPHTNSGVINGNFLYPNNGSNDTSNNLWDLLPGYITVLFFRSFDSNERKKQRVSLIEWSKALKKYQYDINCKKEKDILIFK